MKRGYYIWEYSDRDHKIRTRLKYYPHHLSDVSVWWNNQQFSPDALLSLSLNVSSVYIIDLVGNNYYDGPLNRKGLGTFVVNIAVQILQATYEPSVEISGKISDKSDKDLPIEKQKYAADGRRKFWSRFGLRIMPVDSNGNERMTGTIGELKTFTKGTVNDLFPVFLNLNEFKHTTQTPF